VRLTSWLRGQSEGLWLARTAVPADRAGGLVVLVIGLSVVIGLMTYNLQPYSVARPSAGRSWEEYLLVNLCALVLAPALAVGLTPSLDWCSLGWRRPAAGAARTAALWFALMAPVLYLASRQPAFQGYYPLQPEAAQSWRFFAVHEFTYGAYLLAWEAFFRGFLTFGVARLTGVAPAIVLQALAFGVMHLGKPPLEVASSFVGGALLGALAIRGGSFLPCFALHWAISTAFDVLVIGAGPGGIF